MADHRRPHRPLPHSTTPIAASRRRSVGARGVHRAVQRAGSGRGGLFGGTFIAFLVACTASLALTGGGTGRSPGTSTNDLIGFGAVADGHGTTGSSVSAASTPTHRSSHPHRKHRGKPGSGSHQNRHRHTKAPQSSQSGTTSPHHPDPGGPSSCVSQAQGIPQSGAYMGGAVGGTASLPSVERNAGRPLAIHRTYYVAGQEDYAIASVKADLAAGRLPWISFKMPYSWADMAAGRGDAWTTDLADKLARVGGPVWLAFHHEPEGDGNMQDWKRMQQHLAPIIHARTNNVAYTVILMGWNSFSPKGPADQHIDLTYPGSQYVDILGVDLYNRYGAKSFIKESLDPMQYFGPIGKFARQHGVDWAIGETGYTKQAANVDPNWLQTAYRDLQAEGGLALSYFNSSRNSMADWTLSDPVRAGAFNSLLSRSVRLCSN